MIRSRADQFPRPIIINSATDGKTTANLRHYLRGQTSQSASNFSTTQPPTLSTSACHFGALQSTPAYDFDDDEDYSEVYEETDLPVDRTRMQDAFGDHGFEHSFPGFPHPAGLSDSWSLSVIKDTPVSSDLMSFVGSLFSSPTESGQHRTVAHSTICVNGHKTDFTREKLDDQETIVVKENGLVTTRTISGQPHAKHLNTA